MLGLGNTRVNQLEAENRRLRAELLPPSARMATDAVKLAARQLEPSIKSTKGQ